MCKRVLKGQLCVKLNLKFCFLDKASFQVKRWHKNDILPLGLEFSANKLNFSLVAKQNVNKHKRLFARTRRIQIIFIFLILFGFLTEITQHFFLSNKFYLIISFIHLPKNEKKKSLNLMGHRNEDNSLSLLKLPPHLYMTRMWL